MCRWMWFVDRSGFTAPFFALVYMVEFKIHKVVFKTT